MSGAEIRYDQMIDEALRGVVRTTLRRVLAQGLPGDHQLYISFRTQMPGVTVPDYLAQRYADEMTIVLQFQFWDLEIGEEAFSVTLSFNKILERLTVPFAAITSFADPAAQFGLQFKDHHDDDAEEDDGVVYDEPDSGSIAALPLTRASSAAGETPPRDDVGEKVVALDKFRRK